MSTSDLNFIFRYMRKLPKDEPHELKEFFPEGIWKNKSNSEKRALGRRFKKEVRDFSFKHITCYVVKSNRHTYYFISK